ncbi:MAG: winged helix-turn-helix transcriptional regulator [Archaeoglobi archaeon]|nr:winged helix-turn-helix transcriptional regulator [Candidatus Mnemosynella sp.]
MTQKDLINETSLSPRTVRHAIQRLKEKGLIIEKFYFKDARQRLYCPSKN